MFQFRFPFFIRLKTILIENDWNYYIKLDKKKQFLKKKHKTTMKIMLNVFQFCFLRKKQIFFLDVLTLYKTNCTYKNNNM